MGKWRVARTSLNEVCWTSKIMLKCYGRGYDESLVTRVDDRTLCTPATRVCQPLAELATRAEQSDLWHISALFPLVLLITAPTHGHRKTQVTRTPFAHFVRLLSNLWTTHSCLSLLIYFWKPFLIPFPVRLSYCWLAAFIQLQLRYRACCI